jgi:hypothetical protein
LNFTPRSRKTVYSNTTCTRLRPRISPTRSRTSKKGENSSGNPQDLSYALRDWLKGHWATHQGRMPSADQANGCLRDVPEEHRTRPCGTGETHSVPPAAMVAREELADAGHDAVVDNFIYVPSPPGSSRRSKLASKSQLSLAEPCPRKTTRSHGRSGKRHSKETQVFLAKSRDQGRVRPIAYIRPKEVSSLTSDQTEHGHQFTTKGETLDL